MHGVVKRNVVSRKNTFDGMFSFLHQASKSRLESGMSRDFTCLCVCVFQDQKKRSGVCTGTVGTFHLSTAVVGAEEEESNVETANSSLKQEDLSRTFFFSPNQWQVTHQYLQAHRENRHIEKPPTTNHTFPPRENR